MKSNDKYLIEVDQISFSYRKKKVLKDISFNLSKGQFISIIGPNGSGKSTLLNLLTGFLKAENGTILLNNRDITSYNELELSQILTYIPQDQQIRFPYTCLEIVLMGRTPFKNRWDKVNDEDLTIIHQSMKETDTLAFTESLITEISGGEKQRILFARALAQTPKILILDESFSSMDIHYKFYCINLLRSKVMNEELTVIMVIHDITMAHEFSDIVLALDEGRLVKWGSKEDVMTDEFLETLFKVSIDRVENRGLIIKPKK